jgi:hypothetical protein
VKLALTWRFRVDGNTHSLAHTCNLGASAAFVHGQVHHIATRHPSMTGHGLRVNSFRLATNLIKPLMSVLWHGVPSAKALMEFAQT